MAEASYKIGDKVFSNKASVFSKEYSISGIHETPSGTKVCIEPLGWVSAGDVDKTDPDAKVKEEKKKAAKKHAESTQ